MARKAAKRQGDPPGTAAALGIRGDRLVQVLKDRGMTDFALCIKSGLTPPVIWKLKKGRGIGRIDTLVKIAIALDVSLDYLVGLSSTPRRNP